MLAAFHRKLVSAPFLGVPTHHTLKRFERINEGPTMIQKNLRENAAAICASSGCKLPIRNHLDDHGLSLLYTDSDTSVAGRSGVKVAWTGSLDNYRDLCELYSGCDRLMSQNDPAQLVLTLYLQGYKDLYNDNSSQPQTWLAAAEGDFAFILHDSRTRYTFVARKGEQFPLYWGADSADADSIIITTVPSYLSPFPPGCAFESQVNDEGEGDSRMFNFVRENPHEQGVDCIRRIDSKGHLCGLTFKSVSGQDLVNMQAAARHIF
ncbi:hypothetical protein CVIRNUC_004010 [Coccomyxa viridis]|uniref:DUF3700 domain-containing protein n=1 Tax=Coccomyxa viridis TaxID=1274662 RepID=A0AAV1I2W2_9CHLO|nr:hypothetical protein CVIRNUC_004010 [Coccomyxa viridis]